MKIDRKKSLLIPVTAALILLASGVLGYILLQKPDNYVRDGVDYAPSTSQDRDYNDSIKQGIVDENSKEDAPDSTTLKSVKPFISVWGQPSGSGTDLTINGYVPSIVEADGQCTVTLVKDGVNVSVSKASLQNAQNTSCGQLKIAYSSLSPGVWKATLTYKSVSSEGTSAPVDIEVK